MAVDTAVTACIICADIDASGAAAFLARRGGTGVQCCMEKEREPSAVDASSLTDRIGQEVVIAAGEEPDTIAGRPRSKTVRIRLLLFRQHFGQGMGGVFPEIVHHLPVRMGKTDDAREGMPPEHLGAGSKTFLMDLK